MSTFMQQLHTYRQQHLAAPLRVLHWLTIPGFWLALSLLLWTLPPVPGFRQGIWAVAVMFGLYLYYQKQDRHAAWVMAGWLLLVALVSHALFLWLGVGRLRLLGLALLLLAGTLQTVGHLRRGERPECLLDARLLATGPLWLLGPIMDCLDTRQHHD